VPYGRLAPILPTGLFFDWPEARAVVDLRQECEQVEEFWTRGRASWVALSVAAAFAFHRTRRNVANLLFPEEYANALDIAAAALSCVIPIYTPDGRGLPVPVPVNLARHRFRGGATKVQRADGTVVSPLDVVRRDLPPALVAIEGANIDYAPPTHELNPKRRRSPVPRRV
jgi:hypothetical protein